MVRTTTGKRSGKRELLRYQGSVRDFRAALQANRLTAKSSGTLAGDELGRRRFQRRLREAEMRSIRRQILRGGGDAA